MEHVLKYLPVQMLYGVIAMLLVRLGNYLKGKDANDTGKDDALGNVCIAMAPAVAAFEDSNENTLRKTLKAVRDTIDNYLKQ